MCFCACKNTCCKKTCCKNALFMICSLCELHVETKDIMQPTLTTEFHRKALLSVLAGLFALAGCTPGGGVVRVPRAVQLKILRLLRPAESALRRLIFVLALSIKMPDARSRRSPSGTIPRGQSKEGRIPPFRLFDPRKSFPELSPGARRRRAGVAPTIYFFDGRDTPPTPPPEDPVHDPDDATRLLRRMQAMQKALQNMMREARRLRRAMAKRQAAPPGPKRYGPLRPGWPPGYRYGGRHEVDALLYECGFMARRAMAKPPDTS